MIAAYFCIAERSEREVVEDPKFRNVRRMCQQGTRVDPCLLPDEDPDGASILPPTVTMLRTV